MSEDEQEIPIALELTLSYKNGYSGLLVGFIREFPFITGQAETFEKLSKELSYDLAVYSYTFSEGKKKVLGLAELIHKEQATEEKRREVQTEQGWTEKRIECKIPSRRS